MLIENLQGLMYSVINGKSPKLPLRMNYRYHKSMRPLQERCITVKFIRVNKVKLSYQTWIIFLYTLHKLTFFFIVPVKIKSDCAEFDNGHAIHAIAEYSTPTPNRGSKIGVLKSRFPAVFSPQSHPPYFTPESRSRPLFLRDFLLDDLDYWNRRYIRLTFWQLSVLIVKVLNIKISDRNFIFCFAYFFVRASVHVFTSIF